MKKIILPLFLSACAFTGSAQINNGGFENWTKILLFEHPTSLTTTISSNYETYFDTGELNVYEIQHDGSNALHIENIQGSEGVQPGYFLFGKPPTDNGLFGGGFPVTDSQITGISMDLNYAIADGSEGFIILQFKNIGEPVGAGNYGPGTYFFPISGTQDWDNVQFHFDAPIGVTPDQCVIGFASGDVMNSDSPYPLGSFLEVDNLKFVGSEDNIPGGDFETWVNVDPIMVPTDCDVNIEPFTPNFMQSIDEYEGSFALKLKSQLENDQVDIGYALMGNRVDGQIVPNIYLDNESTTVSFQYNYQAENDRAEAHITLYQQSGDNFIPILEKKLFLDPNESYGLVEYNYLEDLQSNLTTADYMSIEFKSSSESPSNTPQDGSTLLLDDLQLSGSTGIASGLRPPAMKTVFAYPNPTTTRVEFRFHTNRAGYYRVFNSNGTQIDIQEFSSTNHLYYDLIDLPAGKYIFQFYHNDGVQIARVVKI